MPAKSTALSQFASGPALISALVPGKLPEWKAHYAWSAARGGPKLAARLFRLSFSVSAEVREFIIHVSADSRYRLWLNGTAVGFGPAKGSLARYYFETYDIAAFLRVGENVLAAEVRHFGENSPVSEVHSPVPGFLMQSPTRDGLDTPGTWRIWTADSVTPDTTAYIGNAHQFLNHLDLLDTRREPYGWRDVGYDDRAWETAISTGPAAATGSAWGVLPMRNLVPRDVPAMSEVPARFVRTVQSHEEITHVFGPRPSGWKIAAGQSGALLLDAGQYVTGFPEIEFDAGADREVRITYAEALGTWGEVNGKRVWRKQGRRDDFLHHEPHGYRDTVILRGGHYHWEPFYWRAFRYVYLEVLPGPGAVEIRDARYRFCVHPQRFTARFEASDPDAKQIFAVSVHTLQTGAHEIYDDSPYFEQLSYIADTRIEALASLHLCNETQLPKRNLRLFLDTLRSDGLLDARVPCQYERQTIPYFCLHWIFAVEDYWKWMGVTDQAFICECLVAVDTILGFFRSKLRPDGFVGVTGGWNMVDQVATWPKGEPPAVTKGGSTYLSCLYVEALSVAVRLHREAGFPGDAIRWRKLRDSLKLRIRIRAWDAPAGLFKESASGRESVFSHHTQAGAINAGVATVPQAKRILPRLWTDETLIRSHSMQSFYVARALERTASFGAWHGHLLGQWRDALKMNVTSWPEYPDPSRSDSHAWAAWPAVDYVTTVLGIRPRAPGWKGVRLAPQFEGLDWARGEAPSPKGKIKVAWRKQQRQVEFVAQVPAGLLAEVVLPGMPSRQFVNGGTIKLTAPLSRD